MPDLVCEGGCAPRLNLMLVLEDIHAGRATAIVQQGAAINAMGQDPHQGALAGVHTASNCRNSALSA